MALIYVFDIMTGQPFQTEKAEFPLPSFPISEMTLPERRLLVVQMLKLVTEMQLILLVLLSGPPCSSPEQIRLPWLISALASYLSRLTDSTGPDQATV